VQPQHLHGGGADRPIVLETGAGSWTLRGELHLDVTPQEILRRM
jgi:hypothetical protein